MSDMIPQELVDSVRLATDVIVDSLGIDCDLYILSNPDVVEDLETYAEPADHVFGHYTAKVAIDWSPSTKRLRKLGLFAEDDIPIVARFPNKATNDADDLVDIAIIPDSYFSISMQYVPSTINTAKFDIVDVLLEKAHDKVTVKVFRIVPRRQG